MQLQRKRNTIAEILIWSGKAIGMLKIHIVQTLTRAGLWWWKCCR